MQRPLDDIAVLDLGQIYMGGYSGLLLSYLGADVVKVEPPHGENVRTRSEDGEPPQYQFFNANKKGVTINLKSDEGRNKFLDLVEVSDVVLENYSSGTMERLGVGYDRLKEVNPQIVYGHGSGYGDYGPYADYPAMDLTIQAISGVMHTTGFADSPPVKAGPAICDFLGGVHLTLGIVSALRRRDKTGDGDYVDVGMMDCVYPTLASPIASYVNESGAPPRTGNRHSGLGIAPYNSYEASDGYVTIICVAERHWNNLAKVMGRADLVEVEGYDSKAARAKRIEKIDELVNDWAHGQSREEVVEQLLEANVPCAPVQNIEEIVNDDHLREREMINELPNPSEGKSVIPVPGMPIKFSNVDDPEVIQAPKLGEHNAEVFGDKIDIV